MRLPLPCLTCLGPRVSGPAPLATTFVFAELEGEHKFKITCPKGHETIIALRQPRFKILFESGALALIDGYYREAVATMATSLERFHEYWMHAMLIQQRIDREMLKSTWKLVASQSERQQGAFFLLYLQSMKRIPPNLSKRFVEFRNDVIHKGVFPSSKDAESFAEAVLGLIAPMNRELQTVAKAGITALTEEQEKDISMQGAHAAAIVTIVGRVTDNLPKPVYFKAELAQLNERRQGKGFAELSA